MNWTTGSLYVTNSQCAVYRYDRADLTDFWDKRL